MNYILHYSHKGAIDETHDESYPSYVEAYDTMKKEWTRMARIVGEALPFELPVFWDTGKTEGLPHYAIKTGDSAVIYLDDGKVVDKWTIEEDKTLCKYVVPFTYAGEFVVEASSLEEARAKVDKTLSHDRSDAFTCIHEEKGVSAYDVGEPKPEIDMQDICGCEDATTLTACEKSCPNYSGCCNVALANDILAAQERGEKIDF